MLLHDVLCSFRWKKQQSGIEVINVCLYSRGNSHKIGTKNSKWLVKCHFMELRNFWQSDIYTNDQVFINSAIDWVWSAIKPLWKFYSLQWLTWLNLFTYMKKEQRKYIQYPIQLFRKFRHTFILFSLFSKKFW